MVVSIINNGESTVGVPINSTHHTTTMGMLYVMLSSMTYLAVCLAAIFLLIILLIVIVLVWCWCVRPKMDVPTKTVRYSSLHSDDEDERKKVNKKSGRRLLFSDRHRVQQHSTHISQRTSPKRQWGSIPINPNIDINAGHLLLAYIEDNLRDKSRLDIEWEQLQTYLPEGVNTLAGLLLGNKHKNRYPDILPYDHNRVKLSVETNASNSDYINASYIVDVDPNHPKYIVTQGPMQHTISDFWQLVWEQSVTIIVMLTPLSDIGLSQSCQYWPSNGVSTYHHFEVRLVSEHHHTGDCIVRSFYILNLKQQSSRTVTQFHFLTWSSSMAPPTPTPLLEFRRKVNSAHTQSDTSLLIHCSEGVGRTGTYCLIDMTLSRISSGAKEINLAATVEHLRDQRPQMVKTKAQFEFALLALVEETQGMLDAAQRRSSY